MSDSARKNLLSTPLVQLALAAISASMVASLDFGWTLFVHPIDARHHWGVPAIQFAYSTFVLVQTGLAPLQGYLVDRFGPPQMVLGAGTLVALAWFINSEATSLNVLYLGNALAGIGAGCVYVTGIGQAIKWFPKRRGLAAGVVAAGYGAGTALVAGPLGKMIQSQGYEHAFVIFGLIQGVAIMLVSQGMQAPPATVLAERHEEQTQQDYTPGQVLRSPLFYLVYLLYALVAFGGLTMAPSLTLIAKDLNVADALQVPGVDVPTGTMALWLNRTFDGAGRITFAWISDHIGRELTMAFTFLIGGCTLLMLENNGSDQLGFILITTIYFASYGQIFGLFPATLADTFGPRYATAIVGMLYTAKGTGAVMAPAAAAVAATHGWSPVFIFAMCCNVLAALLAVMVLAPMRMQHFEQSSERHVFRTARRSRGR